MKLCLLLLAHFVADFVLQSSKMANEKVTRRVPLIAHCLIYSVAILSVTILYGLVWDIIIFTASVSLSHFITDAIRVRLQKKRLYINKRHLYIEKREFRLFITDQCIHISILAASSLYLPDINPIGRYISDAYYAFFTPKLFTVTIIAAAYILCLHPTGVFIKKVFLRVGYQKSDTEEENKGGFLIGVLERVCILTLALMSQFTAISFVIAAKSLARIKQLEDRDFAEKYLVGTLLSVVIALLSGIAVQRIL